MFALWLFALPAFATTPVALPAGERPEDWAEALALAGLGVAPAGAAATVVIRATASGWVLSVRDKDGRLHEVPVPTATSDAGREDIAWLASSLVDRVAVPPGGAPPTPAAAPAPTPAPAPRPVVRPVTTPAPPPPPAEPPPAPVVAAAPPVEPGPPPVPVAPPTPAPEPARVDPAPSARAPVRLSVGASSALSLRPGTAPVPAFALDLGVLPRVPVYVGLSVTGALAAPLLRLDGEQTLVDADLDVLLGYHPQRAWPVRADVQAGVSWRQFRDATGLVAVVPFPTLGARAGFAFALTDWASVEPAVRLEVDLRGADLTVDGGPPVALSPVSVAVGVTFRSTFAVADLPR